MTDSRSHPQPNRNPASFMLDKLPQPETGGCNQAQTCDSAVNLSRFDNSGFMRGRSYLIEALWILVQALLVSSFLPGTSHRVLLLRAFGSTIGRGVTIKPRLRVKFPWRLRVGDHVWLGEDVWIDNLADVRIGSNVCISQGTYLCTGSHDWKSRTFDLRAEPITVGDGAWLAARTTVGPGVEIGEGAVLTLASAAYSSLAPWSIYCGVPAALRKARVIAGP